MCSWALVASRKHGKIFNEPKAIQQLNLFGEETGGRQHLRVHTGVNAKRPVTMLTNRPTVLQDNLFDILLFSER